MFRDPFAVYVYTVEMIKLVGSRVPATLILVYSIPNANKDGMNAANIRF